MTGLYLGDVRFQFFERKVKDEQKNFLGDAISKFIFLFFYLRKTRIFSQTDRLYKQKVKELRNQFSFLFFFQ